MTMERWSDAKVEGNAADSMMGWNLRRVLRVSPAETPSPKHEVLNMVEEAKSGCLEVHGLKR